MQEMAIREDNLLGEFNKLITNCDMLRFRTQIVVYQS